MVSLCVLSLWGGSGGGSRQKSGSQCWRTSQLLVSVIKLRLFLIQIQIHSHSPPKSTHQPTKISTHCHYTMPGASCGGVAWEEAAGYKQKVLNNLKQFYSTLEMNQSKPVILLLVTLFATTCALRVSHQSLHLHAAVVPQGVPPLEYNPNVLPNPNVPPPVSNPPPSPSPTQPNSPPAQPNPQPAQPNQPPAQPPAPVPQPNGVVPNSIPPLPYPTNCSNGKIFNETVLNCVCPADKPNADSTDKCIACENNQTFNPKTKKCECQGDFYDDGTGKCASCPAPAAWDLKNKKCVRCPDGFTFDQNVSQCVCPKEKPYLDANNVCQACNGEWDNANFKCNSCEANQTWNAATKKCECQGDNYVDAAGKCIACPKPASWDLTNKKCVRCPDNFTFDQKTAQCACPADKPYLDANNNCVACSTKWDPTAFKCLVCTFGTTWNNSTQKCEEKCPFPLVNGKCQCPDDKPSLDPASQECKPCPKETPAWNGKECKACPANSNYISATRTCISCVDGTTFNQTSQNCQATP